MDISGYEQTHCHYRRRRGRSGHGLELIKRGHQVQLLERNAEPGSATSFANGGQLSYRYVAPLPTAAFLCRE